MRPSALISRFFTKLLVYYLAFVMLWIVLGSWYASAFQITSNEVFFESGNPRNVAIREKEEHTEMLDSELILFNRATGASGTHAFGTRYVGYAPTTMLLSLILASPIAWKRRTWALISGAILIHGWIAFGLWLMIVDGYSGSNTLAIYELSSPVKTALSYATFLATKSTVPKYAVPIFFWILVTFRRDDWQKLHPITRTGNEGG